MTQEDKQTGRHAPEAVQLDAPTKARIRAEEIERARVRAELGLPEPEKAAPAAPPMQSFKLSQPAPAGKPGSIGCGTWLILIVLGSFAYYACSGSSRTSSTAVPDENQLLGQFGEACQRAVSRNLKAPATADYPNYYGEQEAGAITGSSAAGWRWLGHVDSQNSFGANIRTEFICTTEPGGSTATVVFP